MIGFQYRDVHFDRKGRKGWLFAKGEVINNSARDYQTAVFRYKLFVRDKIVWSGAFKIVGLRKGEAKPFELLLEGLDYNLTPTITKQELIFENGY